MSANKSFFGNASYYLISNIINAAIPFLLLPILTKVLSPEDYGIVAMFSIMMGIFSALTGLSVNGVIGVRYFQLSKEKLAEYVGSCVSILLISTTLISLLVFILSTWLEKVSGVPSYWLLCAVVFSGIQFICNIRLAIWQSSKQAKKYGAFQICQSLLNACLTLIFIFNFSMGWEGRVLGQVGAIGIFGLVSMWMLIRDGFLIRSKDWRIHSIDVMKFGLPLIPHSIGGMLISTGGQFIVTNTLGIGETGLYAIGAQFGMVMGVISEAFVRAYAPWMFEKLKDDTISGRSYLVGISYVVFSFFLLLSIIGAALVFLAFPYLVGDKYMPARLLTGFFVVGGGFSGMYFAVAGFFFFTSKTKFVSIVTISSGIISLGLMLVLGKRWGVNGIAFGYLLSQCIMFIIAWLLSNRVHPMPWTQFRLAYAMVSKKG